MKQWHVLFEGNITTSSYEGPPESTMKDYANSASLAGAEITTAMCGQQFRLTINGTVITDTLVKHNELYACTGSTGADYTLHSYTDYWGFGNFSLIADETRSNGVEEKLPVVNTGESYVIYADLPDGEYDNAIFAIALVESGTYEVKLEWLEKSADSELTSINMDAFLNGRGLITLVTQIKQWATDKLSSKVDKEELAALMGDINSILDKINGEEI